MRILSIHITHDASCSVINDGILEYYGKEERFTGVKKDKHPFLSLKTIKDLNIGPIDYAIFHTPSNDEHDVFFVYKNYVRKLFNVELENYSNLNHHELHASTAFYNSGFNEALCFIADRDGSLFFVEGRAVARESETVFHYSKDYDTIKPLYKSFWLFNDTDNSYLYDILENYYPQVDIKLHGCFGIVKAYEAATTLINQHPLENGKTMGLSSYGNDKKMDSLFIDGSPIGNKFYHIDTQYMNKVACFVGQKNNITSNINIDNYQYYADYAKTVQLQTQNEVLKLIKTFVDKTGVKNVCISGGYGLNVVANQYYLQNTDDINFYFDPMSDDSGISIGAAMSKYVSVKNEYPSKLDTPFFHYHDNNEIISEGNSATIDDIVNILVDQKSLGLFNGAPEAGPRALGHRSILFDPRNIDAKNIINQIKQREWYRPFAGIIIDELLEEYFDSNGLKKSEYMTVNFSAKGSTVNEYPGIIHVDNTSRIQTVSKGCYLYTLLSNFYEQTGCPILLNTSMNLAGQPLVQTKHDAVQMLRQSSLDCLYFVNDDKLIT